MSNIRKKIMLVDDDGSSRQQGRSILKDSYEVFPLPSAHKLFEVLEVFLPDLILLDIHMPVVDGFETIKRLKSDKHYAHIPVIFLTSSSDKETVLKGGSFGAAGYVTKPFTASELFSHIERCLNPASADSHHHDHHQHDDYITGEKPVILAVDDAPDILRAVHAMLKDKYKVYTLPKPEKLTDILKTITPDMFLLDYQMPGLSGFDLIPIIRRHPGHEDTPIVFLTSAGTIDTLNAAIELGANDFIVKPVDMDVLREKVARHIIKHGHAGNQQG